MNRITTAATLCVAALTVSVSTLATAAHAQFSGNTTYDAASKAYFVTGDATLSGNVLGNEVFVGKDDATSFTTQAGSNTLSIVTGATTDGFGNTYPDGYYYGVNVLGGHKVAISGGSVNYAYGFDTSTTTISGGSVNYVTGFKTSTTTISGGSVFAANGNNTSTLNISGGSVYYAYGFDTSTTTISGGTITGIARSNNTSTLNISGGSVGEVDGFNTSTVNISGGTITDYAYGYDTSTLNISGGSVGEVDGYNTSTVNISGGNGTSGNDGIYAYGYDTSTLNISGGDVREAGGYDNSTVNISNGIVDSASASQTSTLNISGGTLADGAGGFDTSTVNISGGSVGSVTGFDASTFNISGGTLTNGIILYSPDATANFVGTDLSFAYQSYGNNNPYGYYADFFQISGTIGGVPSTYDLYIYNDNGSGGAGTPNSAPRQFNFVAPVVVVPEAGTFALLGIGCSLLCVGIARRRE